MGYPLGLVMEGGGMRGIYGAGVLDCCLQEQVQFPYCIATSAGSANVVSYLAGQQGRNYRFYMQHTKDKRYMGVGNLLRTGSYFGLEFIYDTLTTKIDPIDHVAMFANPAEIRITVTDAHSAQTRYLTMEHIRKERGRVLMAACAVPAMCQPVEVADGLYFDGGTTDPIPVQRALDEGCEKLVVVLSRPRGFVKGPEPMRQAYHQILRKYPKIIAALDNRHTRYNRVLAQIQKLEEEGRAVVIAPSAQTDIKLQSRDYAKIDQLYQLAVENTRKAMPQIREFLA